MRPGKELGKGAAVGRQRGPRLKYKLFLMWV